MDLRHGVLVMTIVACVLGTVDASLAGSSRPSPAPTATPVVGATDAWSQKRMFHVRYASTPAPVPMLVLHDWTVTITDADGRPVDGARVTVLGGMPAHAHGLPTTPTVRALGDGRYLVEGLKFHMPGAWVVAFRINAASGIDSVSFALDLP